MIDSQSAIADPPSAIWSAKQLAEAARQFETHRTGRTPESVTAVLVDDSLVITMRGVMSPAEKDLAKTLDGAAQVRELHRQLFLNSCDSFRQEIEQITGVGVLEATSEVATHTGTVVYVVLLAATVAASTWNEPKSEPTSQDSALRGSENPVLGGES